MGENTPINIKFGRKNGSYNFSQKDNGIQKSAFKNNAASEAIFKKYDKDKNNILDSNELAEMKADMQKTASAHNSKNMGKREARNFLGEDYNGTNAQKDILEFLNTIGSSADMIESAFTDDNGVTTVKYNPENNEQLTEIYKNINGTSILNSQTTVNSSNNSKTTVIYDETGKNPISKTIKKGSAITIELDPSNDRPLRQITDKGSGLKEIIEYKYDDTNGTVTETTTDQSGNVISVKVKNLQGDEIKDDEKISEEKTEENNNEAVKNYRTTIVQNGESPAVIAKKFGCDVNELIELNKDQIKGKGKNQYFLAGAQIKLPDSVSDEQYTKANEGRKSSEIVKQEYSRDAEIRKQKAEATKAQTQAK